MKTAYMALRAAGVRAVVAIWAARLFAQFSGPWTPEWVQFVADNQQNWRGQ